MLSIKSLFLRAFNWIIGKFNVADRLLKLFTDYVVQPIKQMSFVIQAVSEFECWVTARQLEAMSPVASGLLSKSWNVSAKVNKTGGTSSVQVRVTNSAPNAFYRIVGRAPGTMPPVAAIKSWCKLKGIDQSLAFPIAKNIGRDGTHRWRTESNVLNYRRSTNQFVTPNVWSETVRRIEARIK